MNGYGSIFSALINSVTEFGEAYLSVVFSLFTAVFKRPFIFLAKMLRRFLRLVFRGLIVLFAPWDVSGKDYADDVTRAFKKCLKVLFSQPGSFFPVCLYYIKKAFKKYDFGIKTVSVWIIPLVCLVITMLGFNYIGEKELALKISADGELIGFVQNEDEYIEGKNLAGSFLSHSGSENESLPIVTYSLALIDINEFSDSKTICDRLLEKTDKETVGACGVFCDGELLAVLYSENDARDVLEGILAEKKSLSGSYSVGFSEDIEYKHIRYSPQDIISKETFRELLQSGKTTEENYVTEKDETPESVAKKYGMTMEELLELNDIGDAEFFEEGTKLLVKKSTYLLTFKEVKTEIELEEVDFEKIEIQSGALYSGSKRVLVEGKKGYDQVTRFVTLIGDEKVSSSEVYRLNVTDAVPERVQVGTKPLDEAYSNSMGGIFLWPIVGAYGINSDYGYRWGKLHAGIDLGMGNAAGTSLGKTVVAVAQGTVVVAGVHSSYGYYVIIDHGNGLQTLYAHCLAGSLMVVPGQVVVAGQPISRVGSTGYSTGPHLHFEVRVNGNRVNPRPYLGI